MTALQMPTILLWSVYQGGKLLPMICVHSKIQTLSSFILCSNKKVIGICTKSRKDYAIAQTRELACTRALLPQVIAKGRNLFFFR